jgi:hypothetical protein
MSQYRKKPIIVDAHLFTAGDIGDGKQMFLEYPIQRDKKGAFIIIKTLEGDMRCSEGDYLIIGIKGERYPCKRDIFEETYELVTES